MHISKVSSNPLSSSLVGNQELRTALPASHDLPATLSDPLLKETIGPPDELQKTFQDFVGQTFFGQMIASMRSTQEEVPYFNGGRAEKIFQGQLDQVLAEDLSNSTASQFSDPMFKLFQLQRK